MSFSALGLSQQAVAAAQAAGFSQPTVIQQHTIPHVLQGIDVVSQAQTGSGKTLAYALPLLDRLLAQKPARPWPLTSLVLVPTRELAAQVAATFQTLLAHLPLTPKVSVVFGGVSINPQMMALRGGTQLLIATPGRLLDLVAHHAVTLQSVQCLVLDEADRLLELGFSEELHRILNLLPRDKQRLLFSATFPASVNDLIQQITHNPMVVNAGEQAPHPVVIVQRAIAVDRPARTQLLKFLIQSEKWTRVLVFVATKHAAEIVADKLRKANIPAEPFHGLLSQGKRTQVLADFKASRITVVVATDLAARGIDISELPVVVNYDLPRSAVEYTHRIGRTGRAGQNGMAVTFAPADTHSHLQLIQKRNGIALTIETVKGFEPSVALSVKSTPAIADNIAGNGGIKGLRPSKKDKLRAAAASQSNNLAAPRQTEKKTCHDKE